MITRKIFGYGLCTVILAIAFIACENPNDEPAHVHQWGEWDITAATCIATGSRTRTCALDATHTQTETIPIDLVDGHDWQLSPSATAPTCTTAGSETVECKRIGCNETDTQPIAIDPDAHDYQNYTQTTAPTCSAVGKEEAPCTRDSSHEKGIRDIPIDPDAHDWNTETGLCDNDCGELYYSLGDTGPGGGKIFYVSAEGFTMTDDNATAHYLEAAPADMATTLAWASSGYTSTNIAGAAEEIGTGRKNTAVILETDADAPAAKACNDYSNGGKTDWFLPSKDELNQLDDNRTSVGNLKTTQDTENKTHCYWSSSENNNSRAQSQDLSAGPGSAPKELTFSVRAVRAF